MTSMALFVLSFRRGLVVAGFCLAWSLPCAAQKPEPAPAAGARFCEAPSLTGHPGGGVGSGAGVGAGSGDEVKVVFTQSEVTKKAEVLFRPAPDYGALKTEAAEGNVKLRVVLCPRGYVSNIEVLSKAADGLTKKAVEAAREIRFVPAEKDGKRVAQYATVEYSHSVY
jgi:TonB family protein